MAGDRIDIEVVDKINAGIAKKLERIALGADNADESLRGLKNTIKTAEGGSLRLAQAQNALSGAQIRMRAASERLNIIKKKGSATSLQLAAAENRLSAAQLMVRAASERVTMTIKKDAIAKQVAAAKTAKLTSATNRMAVSQNRARAATRGLNTDLGVMLRTGLAFAGAGFGAGAIIRLGESYTMLQNKLKNVTDNSAQLGTVTQKVFEIANRTRSSVDATAQAFQRFDLALMQLGASQSESLRLTETVNKQLIVSGAATSEQASALLQLSQAFNKGKLDGDEFRSVMELMPPVADAIAKQLGVARGELLKLAPDGVITAQVMRDALANAADDVDAKFAKTIPTIGQSFVVLKNKAIQFFGELDKKYGITKKISEMVIALAGNMDILAVALGTVASMVAVAFGPQAVAGVSKLFALMASNPWGIAIVGLTTIVGLLAVFQDEIKVSDNGMVTLGDTFRGTMEVIVGYLEPVVNFFVDAWNSAFNKAESSAGKFSTYFGKALKFTADIAKAYLNTVVGIYVGAYGSVKKVWGQLPDAFKDLFFLASSYALGALEKLINGGIKGINGLLGLVNNLRSELGISGKDLKLDFKLDLSAFRDEGKNAAVDVARTIKSEFTNAFAVDYVGKLISDIKGASMRISKERIASGIKVPDVLRGDGDAIRTAPGGKGSAGAINNKTQRREKFYLDTALVDGFQNKEFQKIFDETHGSMMQIHDAALATDAAFGSGMIGLENYSMRMADLTAETAQLKLEMGDATFFDTMMGSLDMVRDGFQNVATSISQSFGGLFKTLSDGFADSLGKAIVYGDDLATSLRDVAKSAMAELISSIVKMGIQWVVTTVMQAAASKGALAATTAAGVAAASASASAWAPAAAMASLASYGANAAPATAGIAGTSAFARSMAVLPGFESGGYTGDMESNKVAGLVHGKEFVMNAETVRRVGVNNLEAIQRGGENSSTASPTGGSESPGGYSKNETNIYNIIDPDLVVDALNSSQGTEAVLNIISNNPEFIGGL